MFNPELFKSWTENFGYLPKSICFKSRKNFLVGVISVIHKEYSTVASREKLS